jgi:thiol-disulfide isomerase/thioredoxin
MLSFDLTTIIENNKLPISGRSVGPNNDHESSLFRTTLFNARYAMTPRFSLMFSLPYRDIRSPKDVGGSAAKHINRHFSGLGDAILLGRYQLNNPRKTTDSTFHALLGLRLPTGEANPNHTWIAADGSAILSRDAVLQPGYGTFDPILGLQWNKPQPKGGSFYVGTIFRPTIMTNRYGYRFGSEFQFTAGASIPMGRKFTLSPQLLGQFSGYDYDFQPLPGKTAGRVANTGGKWLYFIPSVRYGSLEFNFQVPLYRNTNGNILNSNFIFSVRTHFDTAFTNLGRSKRLAQSQRDEIKPLTGDFKVISRGERVDLASCAVPQKITLFEFASRECSGCKEVTPSLNEILAQRPDVVVRQIDVTNAAAVVRQQYNVRATPSFLVMDKDGKPVSEQPMEFAEVQTWLDKQVDADNAELARILPLISQGEAVEFKEHLSDGKVTVFQFFSPACSACQSIAPGLRYLLAQEPDVTCKRIDVSGEESPVVKQHRVEVTPTFFVFSRQGQFVGKLESADFGPLAKLVQKAKSARS